MVITMYISQTISLRSRCEHALKHLLDEDTVFYLLSLADQLTAKVLKVSQGHYNKLLPFALACLREQNSSVVLSALQLARFIILSICYNYVLL